MKNLTRRAFLSRSSRYALWGLGVASGISAGLSGCVGMDEIVVPDLDTVIRVSRAVTKSFQDITPEQEYYIGRTVGAVILDKYRPCSDESANRYVNLLGQTLAQASDMPETYGGYHFLIQDSDEINALAAPGGLIFITRGILKCCEHEDAVASVLAHEIGHIQFKHGLQAIKASRLTEALTMIGIEGAKAFGGEDLANLTRTFEGSISDITSTLINSGYSRAFENQADMAAVTLMRRVGYDPNGLVDMLNVMQKRLKPAGLDFAKTHPSPASRIADLQKTIGGYAVVNSPRAREVRFRNALRNI